MLPAREFNAALLGVAGKDGQALAFHQSARLLARAGVAALEAAVHAQSISCQEYDIIGQLRALGNDLLSRVGCGRKGLGCAHEWTAGFFFFGRRSTGRRVSELMMMLLMLINMAVPG